MKVIVDFKVIDEEGKIQIGILDMEIISAVPLTDKQVAYYKDLAIKETTDNFERIAEKYVSTDTHREVYNFKYHYKMDGINDTQTWITIA